MAWRSVETISDGFASYRFRNYEVECRVCGFNRVDIMEAAHVMRVVGLPRSRTAD